MTMLSNIGIHYWQLTVHFREFKQSTLLRTRGQKEQLQANM